MCAALLSGPEHIESHVQVLIDAGGCSPQCGCSAVGLLFLRARVQAIEERSVFWSHLPLPEEAVMVLHGEAQPVQHCSPYIRAITFYTHYVSAFNYLLLL